MAVVQPCTSDRVASGPAHWIGPITDSGAAVALCDWLELGQWENMPVPRQLGVQQRWTRRSSRRN